LNFSIQALEKKVVFLLTLHRIEDHISLKC
jgi:hypothetical protein